MRLSRLRPLLRWALPAACLFSAPEAWASGDGLVCTPRWTLTEADRDCTNVPFLHPGNDTRLNIQLLRADRNLATLPAVPPSDGGPAYDRDAPFPISGMVPDSWQHTMVEQSQAKQPPAATAEAPDRRQQDLDGLLSRLGLPPFAGTGPVFADGEGNRCRSDSLSSALAFLQQLAAATALPPADRQSLARGRMVLLEDCTAAASGKAPAVTVGSPAGQDFARYLTAAGNFYAGDFAAARDGFAGLAASSQPWLKETALYMTGRTALNRAQTQATDQYGEFDRANLDKEALAQAGRAFDAYLAAYPKGLYAASAQGLLRRVAWFGRDVAAESQAFARLLAQPDPVRPMEVFPPAVTELDGKFLRDQPAPGQIKDPLLLAVTDLMLMRMPPNTATPPLALADLTAQEPLFAGQPRLFRYLQAVHAFFVGKDPAKALTLLPEAPPAAAPDYLAFSEAMLRGLALQAKGDPAAARKLWLALLPQLRQPLQQPAAQLALALTEERDGRVETVFAPGSPITSREIRRVLLVHAAKAELLRKVARDAAADPGERAVAQFTLLYQELTHGAYGAFLDDLAAQPAPPPPQENGTAAPEREEAITPASLALFQWPGGEAGDDHHACPALPETVRQLKADPRSSKGLLCFGDFILANHMDGFFLSGPVSGNTLGGASHPFTGPHLNRLAAYRRIIADPAAPGDDRAYALYRAINCFATMGNDHCGDPLPTGETSETVAKSDRKAWFHELKTKYKDTVWAQQQKYYW